MRYRPLRILTRPVALATALLTALAVRSSDAQPKPPASGPAVPPRVPAAASTARDVEGAVLAIQGDELVLDLGSGRGAFDGASVEIWRPIKVKHPVTGRVLTDRFRIGTLELTQVRTTLSLARATAPLARPAEIGDIVVLSVVAPAAPPQAAPGGAPPPPPPPDEKRPEDAEARAVSEMFEALRGADLSTRVRKYEEYARANPDSRYVRTLTEEAAALRELLAARQKVAAVLVGPRLVSFSEPREALAGSPLHIAVELADAAGAVLHVRKKGIAGFASFPMRPLKNGYFAATLRPEDATAPELEYFIEATDTGGKPVPLVGTAASPRTLEIFQPPAPYAPRKLPSHVELSTDYADYNRLRNNDRAWQTEGWFGLRFDDVGVRALRSGFGVYRGVGGSVVSLDTQNAKPTPVGLTYGWLEAEFGFVRIFSLGARVAVGLFDQGVTGGAQVLLRIGSDLGTNLLISGEVLGAVGLRGAAQLELGTFPRVPIVLRTEVTNQPAGTTGLFSGDVGGRGIIQIGYRFIPELLVAVRGSFQGRTIQHFGPGLGGAVGYTW
jgi:hypothetical protein